jgi:hypothetical protein
MRSVVDRNVVMWHIPLLKGTVIAAITNNYERCHLYADVKLQVTVSGIWRPLFLFIRKTPCTILMLPRTSWKGYSYQTTRRQIAGKRNNNWKLRFHYPSNDHWHLQITDTTTLRDPAFNPHTNYIYFAHDTCNKRKLFT